MVKAVAIKGPCQERVKTPLLNKSEELLPQQTQSWPRCWKSQRQLEVLGLKMTSPCRTLRQGQEGLLESLGQIRERSGDQDLEWRPGRASGAQGRGLQANCCILHRPSAVWGSVVAWQMPESRLGAERGLPSAALLHHHVEMPPLPVAPSIFPSLHRARRGTLTPRLWPKPVLGAGLAALM